MNRSRSPSQKPVPSTAERAGCGLSGVSGIVSKLVSAAEVLPDRLNSTTKLPGRQHAVISREDARRSDGCKRVHCYQLPSSFTVFTL